MSEQDKTRLAQIMSNCNGLPVESCEDIIEEVCTQITELECGNSEYHSIEEIVVDYLDLPISFARIFIK